MVYKIKPKGEKGLAAVKRLGRNYKTGGFARIAKKAMARGASAQAAKRIAGAVYWKMVRKRNNYRKRHKLLKKRKYMVRGGYT